MNLVDEAIAGAMNQCAAPLPFGESELARAGLHAAASSVVKPPRIAESPASLECVEWGTLQIGGNRVIIGLIKRVHLRDELFDVATKRVRTGKLLTIGRMASPHWYCETTERFEMILLPTLRAEEWRFGIPRRLLRIGLMGSVLQHQFKFSAIHFEDDVARLAGRVAPLTTGLIRNRHIFGIVEAGRSRSAFLMPRRRLLKGLVALATGANAAPLLATSHAPPIDDAAAIRRKHRIVILARVVTRQLPDGIGVRPEQIQMAMARPFG